jgi:hypothetical protein
MFIFFIYLARNLSVCAISYYFSIHQLKIKNSSTESQDEDDKSNLDHFAGVSGILNFETAMNSKLASQYFRNYINQKP